ncbi:MAG: hypothetical protein Q9204_007961, partial [Flavoplaca sp. TL-2023a]
AVLGSAVFFAEQVAYNLSLSTYWSQQEQSLTPSCIVSPQDAQDVSKAIEVLSQYQAAAKSTIASCTFAIRGAGYTLWVGSANIDGGVTIDMTAISTVSLIRAKIVVSVGAGARWSAVYQALDAVGVGVAGGRVANAGVGGLVTGCEVSYFAPSYVFVCYQVINYEIVLANGTAVNANAENNSGLWFALKVRSNNFGDGTQNVAKLQAAIKKYDPMGLFQIKVPGGFKLFNRTAAESTYNEGVANTMSWKDLKSYTNVCPCHCRHRTKRNKDAT